jgi:SNF2 family DNA or RNA helicase
MILADIKTSNRFEHVAVIARARRAQATLLRMLRDAVPEVPLRLAADGIRVPIMHADSLLSLDGLVDLRWSAEAKVVAENRRWAKQVHQRVYTEVQELLKGDGLTAKHLHTQTGLEALDEHQKVSVAAMTVPAGYGLCVFDEQGTGKTVTQIFAFDVLVDQDEADFALIVAPKSMVPEWVRDFERFKADLYKVEVVTGSRAQKRATLAIEADVLVTNFETAVALEPELKALLRRHQGRAVLVIDESYHVKNLDAQRTLALRRLREWCKRAFVLCGSPAPNSPDDLIQQFNIVDFGLTFDGVKLPEDAGQRHTAVQHAIESKGVFVRHLKRDVLPYLPNKQFEQVLLPLQPAQAELYAVALRDYAADLGATNPTTFRHRRASFLARRVMLLQICSNPSRITQGYAEVPAKLRALDKLLDEIIRRRGEKVIVWSFFTASLDEIVRRFAEFNPVRYDGTVADIRLRREAVRRFQEDDRTMLFVGNPSAAGAGLTLHRARVAIYESMSNQTAHYVQSLDRIHRRGQTRDVEYLILLCDRTIEQLEFDRLSRKMSAQSSLLRDPVEDPLTREVLLDEAIAALRMVEGEYQAHSFTGGA